MYFEMLLIWCQCSFHFQFPIDICFLKHFFLVYIYFFFLYIIYTRIYNFLYTEGYNESTEPIDAVNIFPLARFEPTTMTTPPSTTPDIDATNCATETSPKRMFRKR